MGVPEAFLGVEVARTHLHLLNLIVDLRDVLLDILLGLVLDVDRSQEFGRRTSRPLLLRQLLDHAQLVLHILGLIVLARHWFASASRFGRLRDG